MNNKPNSRKPQANTLDPYLEIIAVFDSVHLPAKQREQILAWHHNQVEQYIKSLVPEKKVDEQNIIGTIYGYDVRGEAIKGSYWAGYNAAIDKFNRRLDSSRREL